MLLGTESLENHDHIPKKAKFVRVKAFPMYGGIGVSAPSLHRESTDSLMMACTMVHREYKCSAGHHGMGQS